MKVKIIDSIMGSGKSTWSYNHMLKDKETKFIYICPYLDEIKRFIGDGSEAHPYTKLYYERRFREPKQLGEGKLDSLHSLLIDEYNIATTHSLFKMSTQETIDLIAAGEYTLILDESIDIITMFDIKLSDYNMLIDTNKILIDNDKKITWIDKKYTGDKFQDVKKLCENGTVIELKKTNKVEFLCWNFNIDSFKSFKDVYIMTYLFDASYLKYYFDMHNVEYEKYCIEDLKLIKYENKRAYKKAFIKDNINIYEGHLNNIGDKYSALSVNWFKKNPDLRKKLKNNIYNYFQTVVNAKSEDIIWTTFKSNQRHLQGKGYSKSFLPCNVKATNEFKDCHNIAYCCNRYVSVDYIDYFNNYNLSFNQEAFAISELLQFIWRSAIREGNKINIYLPSKRMRNLLCDWLNNPNI